jgi:hypothetical protein
MKTDSWHRPLTAVYHGTGFRFKDRGGTRRRIPLRGEKTARRPDVLATGTPDRCLDTGSNQHGLERFQTGTLGADEVWWPGFRQNVPGQQVDPAIQPPGDPAQGLRMPFPVIQSPE